MTSDPLISEWDNPDMYPRGKRKKRKGKARTPILSAVLSAEYIRIKKITRMHSDKSFVLNFVTLQSCLCQYVKERRKIKGTKNKRLKP